MISVKCFHSLWNDEDGGVSVDWVVLTAGVLGIALAVTISLGDATADYSKSISTSFDDRGVPSF